MNPPPPILLLTRASPETQARDVAQPAMAPVLLSAWRAILGEPGPETGAVYETRLGPASPSSYGDGLTDKVYD